MGEFADLLHEISHSNDGNQETASTAGKNNTENTKNDKQFKNIKGSPFDIQKFAAEIKNISKEKNKNYYDDGKTISAYDISSNCISQIVKKILNYPVYSFSDKWLPLSFRSTLGNAVHDYIQSNSNQFTETEISVKVPSINFSGRLDCMIGNNILVEIKSVPYTGKDGFKKIIDSKKARTKDIIQLTSYKYILENYLDEAKSQIGNTRTDPPHLDNYKIDTLQFIYVAHDLVAADIDNLSEAIKMITTMKRQLNSRNNPFFFITNIVYNVNDISDYINNLEKWIKLKIDRINYYINSESLPTSDDPFIDRSSCFFCYHYKNCEIIRN